MNDGLSTRVWFTCTPCAPVTFAPGHAVPPPEQPGSMPSAIGQADGV